MLHADFPSTVAEQLQFLSKINSRTSGINFSQTHGYHPDALIYPEYRAMSVSHYVAQLSDPVKHSIDYFAVGAFIMSVLTNVMPFVTALLTAVWVVFRIVESRENIRLARAKRKDIE